MPVARLPNVLAWYRASLILLLASFIGLANTAGAIERITYYHNDVSGTPLLATDAAGNVLWKENYRPYGEKLNNPAAAADNRLGFAGKPYDEATGLSYMGARYYDPALGRFMGIDPKEVDVDEVHSFNRYAYANNNPYKFVDPDGHSPLDVVFLLYDFGKLGHAIYKGEGVGDALQDVAWSVVGVASPVPYAVQAMRAVRAAEHAADVAKGAGELATGIRSAGEVAKAAKGEVAITSRAARREAMRDAGIPTSQQPMSQTYDRATRTRELSYEVPAQGGGSQRMSVQQQTMDRNHPGQPHWEAGRVKTDPLTGEVRQNSYGRPALVNNKSKVNY